MLLDKLSEMEQTAPNVQELRSRQRRHLMYYLRIFDRHGGGVLGRLADLTEEGLMLLCPSPLKVGQVYRLRLVFPERIAERTELLFEATCRWCRPDVNPELQAAGLQIHHIQPGDKKFLLCLIDDFAFRD